MLNVILHYRLVLVSEGINVLLRRIQNRLIDAGYVTTRVVVEPQDLRSGVLVLTVIPGKVGRIQLQDQSAIHLRHAVRCGLLCQCRKETC